MGLDMYLNIAGEEDELIYWRKANQIFKWFETHCANGKIEDCVPVPVTKGDLLQLLEDIKPIRILTGAEVKTIIAKENVV